MLAQTVPEPSQTATPTTQAKLPAVRRREMGISDQLLAAYLLSHSEARAIPRNGPSTTCRRSRCLLGGTPIDGPAREKLARYSGFGGLSIDRIAERLPAQWQPEADGLIHEYYAALLCRELARVLRPYIARIPTEDGIVRALEPSAGNWSLPSRALAVWFRECELDGGRILRALFGDVARDASRHSRRTQLVREVCERGGAEPDGTPGSRGLKSTLWSTRPQCRGGQSSRLSARKAYVDTFSVADSISCGGTESACS